MTNAQVRRSISATLAEIEQAQLSMQQHELDRNYLTPDDDAAQALEIIKRIEAKLLAIYPSKHKAES